MNDEYDFDRDHLKAFLQPQGDGDDPELLTAATDDLERKMEGDDTEKDLYHCLVSDERVRRKHKYSQPFRPQVSRASTKGGIRQGKLRTYTTNCTLCTVRECDIVLFL